MKLFDADSQHVQDEQAIRIQQMYAAWYRKDALIYNLLKDQDSPQGHGHCQYKGKVLVGGRSFFGLNQQDWLNGRQSLPRKNQFAKNRMES